MLFEQVLPALREGKVAQRDGYRNSTGGYSIKIKKSPHRLDWPLEKGSNEELYICRNSSDNWHCGSLSGCDILADNWEIVKEKVTGATEASSRGSDAPVACEHEWEDKYTKAGFVCKRKLKNTYIVAGEGANSLDAFKECELMDRLYNIIGEMGELLEQRCKEIGVEIVKMPMISVTEGKFKSLK